MSFSSSTVTIGQSTKKSDYDRLLDNTQYNKTELAKASKGKAEITISNYDNSSSPVIQAGSIFDNNGVLIDVISNATPNVAGYTAVSVSTAFYIYWDESGGVFIYSAAAPTWSDILQGWYNGNDRAFFSMYKDSGGTLYEAKAKLEQENKIRQVSDYGEVGSLVMGSSTEFTLNTIHDPGKTVTGGSIVVSTYTSGGINLSCEGGSIYYGTSILSTRSVSLGLVGTWITLARVRQSSSSVYPGCLFQRIS